MAEAFVAAVLLTLGIFSLEQLAAESAFMHRFVLVPVEDIEASLDDVSILAMSEVTSATAAGLIPRIVVFASVGHLICVIGTAAGYDMEGPSV